MRPENKTKLLLWLSFLGAPVTWLIYLQSGYLLVIRACATGNHLGMHLASILALATVGGLGAIAWTQWARYNSQWPSEQDAETAGSARTMSAVGLMNSGLFALLITVSWIAMFLLHPCDQ